MTLSKQAKSTGGDKYDGKTPGGKPINIYLPQDISRATGFVAQKITLNIEVEDV
jgi:hypothetical protein